jgi:hypothetical protein
MVTGSNPVGIANISMIYTSAAVIFDGSGYIAS